MSVKAIPDGYYTVTPYLIVKDPALAIDFYTKAFGATEICRFPGPGGSIVHAEIQIGNSRIMMGQECPAMGAKGPETLGGSPVGIMLYVEDVDSAFPKAIAAGGKEVRPLTDQFYGDRSGTLTDPFGHNWTIGSHKEDVSVEEMQRRMTELMAKRAQSAA